MTTPIIAQQPTCGSLTRAGQLLLFGTGLNISSEEPSDATFVCKNCNKDLKAIQPVNRDLEKLKSGVKDKLKVAIPFLQRTRDPASL